MGGMGNELIMHDGQRLFGIYYSSLCFYKLQERNWTRHNIVASKRAQNQYSIMSSYIVHYWHTCYIQEKKNIQKITIHIGLTLLK